MWENVQVGESLWIFHVALFTPTVTVIMGFTFHPIIHWKQELYNQYEDVLVWDNPKHYRMMVERYTNLKEEVGSSILDCEISSLPKEKLATWSSASCALTLACWPSIFKKKQKQYEKV